MSKTNTVEITERISLDKILPSSTNPRTEYNGMEDLANSITKDGIIQDPTVRPHNERSGFYEIVVGHRRCEGARLAGLSEIKVKIRELSDEEAFDLQITENLQREDLSPLEESEAYYSWTVKKGASIEELSARFGKSKPYMYGRLKLRDLNEDFKALLKREGIMIGAAIMVAQLNQEQQEAFFENDVDPSGITSIEDVKDWISRQEKYIDNFKFDPEDPSLNPSMGACSKCPLNTKNQFLFPDDPVIRPACMNKACMEQKQKNHVEMIIELSKKDENVMLLHTRHGRPDKNILKDLTKRGVNVLSDLSDYEVLESPEPPDRDDYFRWVDHDDPEELAKAEQEYADAMEEYQEEINEYQEKLKNPKAKLAYYVTGYDAGRQAAVLPRKNQVDEKIKVDPIESLRIDIEHEKVSYKEDRQRLESKLATSLVEKARQDPGFNKPGKQHEHSEELHNDLIIMACYRAISQGTGLSDRALVADEIGIELEQGQFSLELFKEFVWPEKHLLAFLIKAALLQSWGNYGMFTVNGRIVRDMIESYSDLGTELKLLHQQKMKKLESAHKATLKSLNSQLQELEEQAPDQVKSEKPSKLKKALSKLLETKK